MILYGTELVKKLRKEFDKAQQRIWIVVPFIGGWNAVKKIMGTKWITDYRLDIKIITDIGNEGFINSETIKQFLHRANVKTLPGLHAKIYIIDNSVFITSANLTETAFSKRYEICEYQTISSSHDIIAVFNKWWKKSNTVNNTWQPTKTTRTENETGNISALKKLWELPEGPIKIYNFKDYQDNISCYWDFKNLYENINQRLIPYLPIFHEIDAIFNFLYHERMSTPSHAYIEKPYRNLSEKKRSLEIRKYKNDFSVWLKKNPNAEKYRLERIKLIQKKLSETNIRK